MCLSFVFQKKERCSKKSTISSILPFLSLRNHHWQSPRATSRLPNVNTSAKGKFLKSKLIASNSVNRGRRHTPNPQPLIFGVEGLLISGILLLGSGLLGIIFFCRGLVQSLMIWASCCDIDHCDLFGFGSTTELPVSTSTACFQDHWLRFQPPTAALKCRGMSRAWRDR